MSPSCKVTPGFCLLILWFAYINGWRLLGIVLAAAVLHEAGHWLALRLLGGRITAFQISVLGAVLKTDSGFFSYPGELAVVLAGPAANLLAACLLGRAGLLTASGAHLVLAAFNLLPLWPLDGGRALELLVCWRFGPEVSFCAVRWAGVLTAAVLAGGLLYVVWYTGGSLWLLPAAAGILAAGGRSLTGNLLDT